ncbi:MAG: VOC family protein [Opitutae bacterium]|nr:VOC family protein [Opitutae bacterium]
MPAVHADKLEMQHRLFAELSRMFGSEVPLYDKSLLVNRVCNEAIGTLLGQLWRGFAITAEQLEKTSGERHGAIRIGRPDEYRWIGRFFAQFAMEPHAFYDMTNVGAKSQPIIATAFRSRLNPEHRVFTSLLMTDYFDPATRARIEALLATRQVFSVEAKRLIEQGERDGGLSSGDAEALMREATGRIFKWTGHARDHALYEALSKAGFKIAADIACFESHHLNHLTPNTLWMDVYTSAMKFCLGEIGEAAFRAHVTLALEHLVAQCDRDYLRLHFKHLAAEELAAFELVELPAGAAAANVDALTKRLKQDDLNLSRHKHSGFKDSTEGPAADTPVLLRQDSYKALTEPVQFTNPDGTIVNSTHTARFGEIEQRFYATTPKGRELYDRCLAAADAAKERHPGLAKKDFAAYERLASEAFAPFPKQLFELVEQGLVFARFSATAAGRAAAKDGGFKRWSPLSPAATGVAGDRDAHLVAETRLLVALARAGFVAIDGLRYEDFLPISAAGIFASNLQQYGTQSTAHAKPTYTQAQLEEILGRTIIDPNETYAALEAESRAATLRELGLREQ